MLRITNSALAFLLAAASAFAVMTGCDDGTVIPDARNSITGTVDGTEFTAVNVRAIKDTNDVFTITGRIQGDVRFNMYFVNEDVTDHAIQTEGNFLEFIDQLDSLSNIDPPIEDSLVLDSLANGLLELLASDSDPLAPDRSFAFYIIGNFIYYSIGGGITITDLDTELNRFSGTCTIQLLNFFGGRKQWEAVLDDIEYFE